MNYMRQIKLKLQKYFQLNVRGRSAKSYREVEEKLQGGWEMLQGGWEKLEGVWEELEGGWKITKF